MGGVTDHTGTNAGERRTQMGKIFVVLASAVLAVGLHFFGSYPGNEDGMGQA
jgi:hypothetical protein